MAHSYLLPGKIANENSSDLFVLTRFGQSKSSWVVLVKAIIIHWGVLVKQMEMRLKEIMGQMLFTRHFLPLMAVQWQCYIFSSLTFFQFDIDPMAIK